MWIQNSEGDLFEFAGCTRLFATFTGAVMAEFDGKYRTCGDKLLVYGPGPKAKELLKSLAEWVRVNKTFDTLAEWKDPLFSVPCWLALGGKENN